MRSSLFLNLAVSAIVASLAGCGGGSGGLPDATTSPVVTTISAAPASITMGKSFIVSASATSRPNALSSAAWSVTSLTAGAGAMTVANGDCSNATKSTQTINNITQSTWSCDAVFTAPASVAVDSTYQITFSGTDSSGNANSKNVSVVIPAGTSISTTPPVAVTQAAVTVNSGAAVGLSCYATGGVVAASSKYVINWVTKSNPSGLNLGISVSSDGTLTFNAPAVISPATVGLECRVTDDNNALGVSSTIVTIVPSPSVVAISNAGSMQSVLMGTSVSLDGSQSSAAGSPALYYKWTQTEGPTVSLSSATSVAPTFTAPVVADTTRLTFQLVAMPTSPADAATAAPSEISTVAVYVTPHSPLTLNITAATVVAPLTAQSLTVSATPADTTLYYAWSQVSGPSVTLGGANTATASFVSANVASGTGVESVFQVQVSRKPLAQSSPGDIVSADVVILTKP